MAQPEMRMESRRLVDSKLRLLEEATNRRIDEARAKAERDRRDQQQGNRR